MIHRQTVGTVIAALIARTSMRRSLVAAAAAWPLVGSPAVAEQDRPDNCYAQLTMRQVQTGDYSYEVLQNCQIVPRIAPHGAVTSEAQVGRAPRVARPARHGQIETHRRSRRRRR